LKNVEAMPEDQAKALFAPETRDADLYEGDADPDVGDVSTDITKKP
jgi:hypothetical protein